MGLFDYVAVTCPSCGGLVEFQTKGAVQPCLDKYAFEDIDDALRAALIGKQSDCRCGATVEIKGDVTVNAWPEVKG